MPVKDREERNRRARAKYAKDKLEKPEELKKRWKDRYQDVINDPEKLAKRNEWKENNRDKCLEYSRKSHKKIWKTLKKDRPEYYAKLIAKRTLQKRENYAKIAASYISDKLNVVYYEDKCYSFGYLTKNVISPEKDLSISLKRLLMLWRRIYGGGQNKTKEYIKQNKTYMKAEIIKAKKLRENLDSNISKMGELGDIILGALISFEDGEITAAQLKSYMNASNAAHKVLFSKFIMEQALIQQFPEEEEVVEVIEETTE